MRWRLALVPEAYGRRIEGAGRCRLASAPRCLEGVFPGHAAGFFALTIGADAGFTLARLRSGSSRGFLLFGRHRLRLLRAPLSYLRRRPSPWLGLLNSRCLNSCMTRPVIRFSWDFACRIDFSWAILSRVDRRKRRANHQFPRARERPRGAAVD